MIDLKNLTIEKARIALDKKEFSAVELAQAYLDAIKEKNKELNAYLEVYADVLEQAKAADERIKKGESTPLLGIPLAIKDNILVNGKKASAGSKILENYVAPYNSTVSEKLITQGAVILGRTNMDEFALGSSTENSAFGPTKNPHDTSRVPGGTSGGSACAVSANLALSALGTDTGGSVRLPSSFCGVVGLKPTYGRVSRYGIVAAASSLEQVGVLGKTVNDVETIYNVIKGNDPEDSTTIKENTYETKKKDKVTIGIPWDLVETEGTDKDVLENFKKSVENLKKLGFEIKEIKLPNIKYCLPLYYIVNFAEVSSNLARYDGMKYGLRVSGKDLLSDYLLTRSEGFGAEAKRRILLGTYVLSSGYYDAYYGQAQMARGAMREDFKEIFSQVDLILTPTSPIPPWKIGGKTDPLSVYLADIFTVTPNIVGVPAISIPSGFMNIEGKNLPLGIQFMAPHGGENLLLRVGKIFLNEN